MSDNSSQGNLFDDDDPKRNFRRDDPDTSRRAAFSNAVYRKGQKWALLKAHVEAFRANPEYSGMNADESWTATGGSVYTKSCYWKRLGELENDYGHLKTVVNEQTGEPVSRRGVAGELQIVRKLTNEGLIYFRKVVAERGDEG
jgi:hypothetical protein